MVQNTHRTIFLSDFHLGSRLCKAEQLLDFILSNDADTWYLVGDVYDLKRLRKRRYWPDSHAEVVRALRTKAADGARVVYLPGNHDPELRERTGQRFNLPGIEVRHSAWHRTADGRRFIVVHGDEHEPEMDAANPGYWAGCAAYISGVLATAAVNRVRRRFGLGYWSLSSALKDRVLHRIPLAQAYRANLVAHARAQGADGVVCGHIHHAVVTDHDGVLYLNCGDWVDSCTALAESQSGEVELIRWTRAKPRTTAKARRPRPKPILAPAE